MSVLDEPITITPRLVLYFCIAWIIGQMITAFMAAFFRRWTREDWRNLLVVLHLRRP